MSVTNDPTDNDRLRPEDEEQLDRELATFCESRGIAVDWPVSANPQVRTDTEGIFVNPDFVSADGYDLCVICRAKTEYRSETPVERRQCYVEGCGQLCFRCWTTKDGAC